MKTAIREEDQINRIRLLPSTSLAIGYYRNFIEQLMNCILENRKIHIGEEEMKLKDYPVRMNVVIPPEIEFDWKKWEQLYAAENGLKSAWIESGSRPLAFMIDPAKLEQEGEIGLIDVPQTMRVAFQAVEMTMKKDYIGEKTLIAKTKQKEVSNFISTLKNLMKEDPFANKYVTIWQKN